MDNKILVAYTSQVDSTASVAEAIGKTLERLVKRKKPDLQSLFRLVTLDMARTSLRIVTLAGPNNSAPPAQCGYSGCTHYQSELRV